MAESELASRIIFQPGRSVYSQDLDGTTRRWLVRDDGTLRSARWRSPETWHDPVESDCELFGDRTLAVEVAPAAGNASEGKRMTSPPLTTAGKVTRWVLGATYLS